MTKAHSETLLSKLKSSLPKPAPVPLVHRGALVAGPRAVSPVEKIVSQIAKPVRQERGLRYPKISVSLYQADIARLDEIKQFMRIQGVRNLTDSEALRLACRAVKVDDDFVSYYRQIQSEDGRRRNKAK